MNLITKNLKQQRNSHPLYFRMLWRLLLCVTTLIFFYLPARSQAKYTQPSWWFGAAVGANFNFYAGSIQRPNEVTTFPSAFRNGFGVGTFAAGLIEYHRPKSVFGFMLQEGLDNRRANFYLPDQKFIARFSYITIEPSLRLAPFRSNFYLYGGPRLAFLMSSSFTYKRNGYADYPDRSVNQDARFFISSLRKNPVSMQVGAGYDIPVLTSKDGRDQFVISPFVSYYPTMWRKNIRNIESLYLNTVRAGIAVKVGRGRRLPPVKPLMPPEVTDRDGDGVSDTDDRCPDIKGLATLKGCPDRDGDGIEDMDDKCPDEFGLVRYGGCPIPDKDKDGVNDELDKCADEFGYARYQGCPIPDTDKDGVNDEEDKCITTPGPASNYGCPVISEVVIQKVNLAASNIFFVSSSAKLLVKSFVSLQTIVNILKDNPTFKIDVEGHTDSTGGYDMNMKLSDDRAASVAAYLKSAGLEESRITSKGYGPDRPIAPNKTVAGRGKNRRVEMKLRNY